MSDPIRIQGSQPLANPNSRSHPKAASAVSFNDILRARQGLAGTGSVGPNAESVRFSAHAQTRLQSRQIALEAGQLQRLDGAVQQAASKGSRDALVLMDNLAMVVSVKNRTVVTVVERDDLKQNVFTNIDSAVIA